MSLLLLLACPKPEDAGPCAPGDAPTLEIGEGATGYAPMGDEATLIHGPQGGYHVEIALEATYIAADDLVSGSLSAFLDGEEVAGSAPWLEFRCNGETETLQSFGTQLIFDIQDPAEVHGEAISFEATVLDLEGVEVQATGEAVVRYPELE